MATLTYLVKSRLELKDGVDQIPSVHGTQIANRSKRAAHLCAKKKLAGQVGIAKYPIIRSPGFWALGEDSSRTAALPKASTMTVSPDARICGGLARMGPVARYDDSCESSSRATARTATGGAPCFATSPIVSHSGRNRSPPTHPRRCAASNLTRGARTARRLTSPSVSLPTPSELALCAPRWLLPDSTIRRKFLNACPNSQQQPREIPSPGVVRARCAYGEPPPFSQRELRFRQSTNMFRGPYAESRVLVRGTQRPSN